MDAQRVRGHVKWFDPERGYGFVLAEEGGPDILLHGNVLSEFGQSAVPDGSPIEFIVSETPRGLQVSTVLRIDPPAIDSVPVLTELADVAPSEVAALPWEPARVKWFDGDKGFGFANLFGSGEDIFVHRDVLRRSAIYQPQEGEAVALRVTEGSQGPIAVQAAPWSTLVKR